jgi:hypothetical protein
MRVVTEIGALDALEEGEDVVEAPATAAHLRPGVVVQGLASVVDGAVDGAGAAEHLAARHVDGAAAGALMRLGRIAPVHLRIVDEEGHAGRGA